MEGKVSADGLAQCKSTTKGSSYLFFLSRRLSGLAGDFLLRFPVHDILAFVIIKNKHLTRLFIADLFIIAANSPSTNE